MSDTHEGFHPLWLDEDVALWLHKIADEFYDGDVQYAMNEGLRSLMGAETRPRDPWKAVVYAARSRAGGRTLPTP